MLTAHLMFCGEFRLLKFFDLQFGNDGLSFDVDGNGNDDEEESGITS